MNLYIKRRLKWRDFDSAQSPQLSFGNIRTLSGVEMWIALRVLLNFFETSLRKFYKKNFRNLSLRKTLLLFEVTGCFTTFAKT